MEVISLLGNLVATIVGGLIVVLANWISAHGERRKAIREWYEQSYIGDGLDILIAYYLGLDFHLRSMNLGNRHELPEISLVPLTALTKVQILLDSPILTTLTLLIHEYTGDPSIAPVPSTAAAMVTKVNSILLDLRKQLLIITQTKVRNKFHHSDLSHVVRTLEGLERDFNDIVVHGLST